MLDELLCNVLRVKVLISFDDFFFNFHTYRTLHSSRDYLVAISMEIYNELSEYRYLY